MTRLTNIIFVFSYLAFAIGLNCTNRCCYYYGIVPKNVTILPCNLEGMDVNWTYGIYSPHENSTNFSVQWYRAALRNVESSDMVQGEPLSEMSGKYNFTTTQLPSTIVNSSELSGLFLHEFAITINNFSSSIDGGYYWCQIVVNDSCPLKPSPRGYVALIQFHEGEKCNFEYEYEFEYDMPLVCAELGTLCNGKTLTTTELHGEQTTHTLLNMSWTMTVILYGVIGGLLFIIILLLLVIVGCTVCNVRNRKMITANKAKYHPGQSLNVYDDQPTKSDDDVFAVDGPGATEESNRKQPILPPSKSAHRVRINQEPTTPTMHALTSRNDEVKYAQPGAMPRHPMISQAEASSPSQYQGLRASGVDAITAYNVPHIRRHEYGSGEVKADLKYANLPM